MKNDRVVREVLAPNVWAVLLVVFGFILTGCQSQAPPLSPAAAAFKKEVKDCIAELSQGLIEPVTRENVAAIQETLKKIEPEAAKLCRRCPFRLGVLNKKGDTLTIYPSKSEALDFSGYDFVVQILKNRKIAQQRLYLQDGYQVFIVCAPLLQGDDLVGILAISLSAAEAKSRWGITEQEFLSLDFNR